MRITRTRCSIPVTLDGTLQRDSENLKHQIGRAHASSSNCRMAMSAAHYPTKMPVVSALDPCKDHSYVNLE